MAKELNAFDKEWYKDAIYDINEIISYFYSFWVYKQGAMLYADSGKRQFYLIFF